MRVKVYVLNFSHPQYQIINCNFLQETIIARANKIVLLDADLANSSLELVNTNETLRLTTDIQNRYKRDQNKKHIRVTNSLENVNDELFQFLEQNENIIVVNMFVNFDLIAKLKHYFNVENDENEYFCHYDSTNEAGKRELTNINAVIGWCCTLPRSAQDSITIHQQQT